MPSHPRSSLGTTWAPYYGRWPGIYVPRVGGGAQQRVVPNKRVWSTNAQPTLSGLSGLAGFIDNAISPFKTAWNYYVPSSAKPTAPATATTGIYTEGGYWYRFNAATNRVVIALSPTSKTEREAPVGSAAHKAIVSQIMSGVAQLSTKAALAAAKLGTAAPSTTRRMRVQPEAEISPLPEESIVTRVTQSPWTPWAVGGVIVAGAAFFLLRPRSPGV